MTEVLAHIFAGPPSATTGWLVDGTVGAGGHAQALLEAAPQARLLGLDRDPTALDLAARRLERFGARVRLEQASYAALREVLAATGTDAPVGVLLDLGLSSMQLDAPARGFSFRGGAEVPDMRFDPEGGDATAATLLNRLTERELATILHEYGEEPRARAVARAIVRARPIRTIEQLREVARKAALPVRRHDPSTRTFQALRIAVNDEFGHLRRGLDAALSALAPPGRLVVICFHSGEERLVKAAFHEAVKAGRGRVLTRKPIRPTSDEVRTNPRARPARLRAFAVLHADGTEGVDGR